MQMIYLMKVLTSPLSVIPESLSLQCGIRPMAEQVLVVVPLIHAGLGSQLLVCQVTKCSIGDYLNEKDDNHSQKNDKNSPLKIVRTFTVCKSCT